MRWKNNLLLLLAAFIWGCAFVAQSEGTQYVGPWTFNCLRSLIGGVTLLVLMPAIDKFRGVQKPQGIQKNLIIGGIACGIVLCAGSMFQQIGIMDTTTGKAGFITALYVILVPILGLVIGHKTRAIVWLGALIALVGFYFLSFAGSASLTLQTGDFYLLICAVLFAVHILVIDHFSFVDGVRMSCIQFFVAGIICMIGMFIFEKPDLTAIKSAAIPILYAGCLSSGAGYTLQIIGQKNAEPAVASMILSLESVFAALSGFVLLHQTMAATEILGCALIFLAVILAQYPEKQKKEAA